MKMEPTPRDYSLLGRDGKLAVETGLAAAQWYHTDVPRKDMKELMKRSDQPAIRDTIIWLGSMLVFALCAGLLWPSLWSIPFFLAYGVLYGSATDSRWHECGHGTAFKTQWMNDWVYQIACFMIVRNPATWRWSHTRHHTNTIIVGLDPEIAVMRPPVLARVAGNFFGIFDSWSGWKTMLYNAAFGPTAEEKTFIPDMEQHKVKYRRADLGWHLCRDNCPRRRHRLVPAADVCRPAPALWRLAPCSDRPAPAWRACGQCAGSPDEFAHRLYEPHLALHLLEHELPCRASHVPDGALSRPAKAA